MKKRILKTVFIIGAFIISSALSCLAAGWVSDGGDNWMYVDKDGFYAMDTIKTSGDEKYYLDMNGNMVRDYLLEDYNDAIYYFDDSGKMVKNTWVAVEPMQVYNQMENPPTIYLYYFGTNGKAYKADDGVVRKVIDGKKYLFNANGQMMSGWINEAGDRFNEYEDDTDPFNGYCYFAGDETDGVLREGWTAYEDGSVEDRYYLKQTLWFYFRTNDNKKVQSENENDLKRKVINGKTYAFDDQGVMAMGWDSDLLDPDNNDATAITKNYFFEEGTEVGRLAKKEWYFAVPSQKQNLDDHDQEIERWFYSTGGGDVVKGEMRRINSAHYAFDKQGIMKSGLVIVDKYTRKYVDTIDSEMTDGRDFVISRHYISKDRTNTNTPDSTTNTTEFNMFNDDTQTIYYFNDDETDPEVFGKRQFTEGTLAFGDDDYTFIARSAGEYEGLKKKKYYQAGIRLKADTALGLGIVLLGYSASQDGGVVDNELSYNNSTRAYAQPDKNHNNIKSDYIVIRNTKTLWDTYSVVPVYAVVNSAGNRIQKSYTVKKDGSKRYWAMGNNATLMNIYEVPVRYTRKNGWEFQSEFPEGDRVKTVWKPFGTIDEYGKTCKASKVDPGDYGLYLDDTYCTNFRFADE